MVVSFQNLINNLKTAYPLKDYHSRILFLGRQHNIFGIELITKRKKDNKLIGKFFIREINTNNIGASHIGYGYNKILDIINDYANEPSLMRNRPRTIHYGLSKRDKKYYKEIFR